jgi:hypothetical protein
MGLQRILFVATGIAAAATLLQWYRHRFGRVRLDGGHVSEGWLAEHRASHNDAS